MGECFGREWISPELFPDKRCAECQREAACAECYEERLFRIEDRE